MLKKTLGNFYKVIVKQFTLMSLCEDKIIQGFG